MSFRDTVLDLLFPPKCPFCGKLLEKGELLCPNCQRDLPWLTGAGAERPVELTKGCLSVLRYQERVREAIHGYKFRGRSARSGTFGLLMAQALRDRKVTADLISWPSLSRKRLRRRGYDQAQLLAEVVGRELGIPVARTLKKEDRPAQSGLRGEAERRANLLGAYTAVNTGEFQGKTILLIDDVFTTGATLSECAKTLRLAGAKEVFCATLARAGQREKER